ncbi:MAG: DUF4404 family protein [Candidatus Dadabacteria bacterium]|nr:MAG: DUF4404 family protein [Candidatus Dadabacteria bacterium]
MPERELRKLLERLRQELATSEDLDPAARERIEAMAGEVEALLAQRQGETSVAQGEEGEQSLVERLVAAAEAFESSHPRLVEAVGRIADALAKLGI